MSSNEDQLKESWYSFPDAEKIPCQADVAIFEGDSGFEVVLPHTFGYSISGIQINSVVSNLLTRNRNYKHKNIIYHSQ